MLLYSKHKNKANLGYQQQERSIQNPVYLMCKYSDASVQICKYLTHILGLFAPPFPRPLCHNSHLLSPGSSRWLGKGGSSLINKSQNNSINIQLSFTQCESSYSYLFQFSKELASDNYTVDFHGAKGYTRIIRQMA